MQITLRQISFVLVILGLSLLFVILNFSSPIVITSPSQLASLEQNQKVIVSGQVIKQNDYYLTLNNNLSLFCESCPNLKNKNISAEGVISKYDNKIQINVLKIS